MIHNILECCHADTCLPDYWSGHHRPHLQIPVHNGMTLKEVKQALHNELNEGAIAGSEAPAHDAPEAEHSRFHRMAKAAINRIRPAVKGKRVMFRDIEESEYADTVYAFFVFMPDTV